MTYMKWLMDRFWDSMHNMRMGFILLADQWEEYWKNLDANDPVRSCPVYLDKENGSCCHVDGPLCDFPKCSMILHYHEGNNK